jgi:hypothetical protein
MNHIRMEPLTGLARAVIARSRGGSAAHDLQLLPRTIQDVALDATSRRAQASTSHLRITPTITSAIRNDSLGSPLRGRTLYVDEPYENQQNDGNQQDSNLDLPVDSPNQEDTEWPLKWPIAPQYCRRWGKPESYVIFVVSTKLSDGNVWLVRSLNVGPSPQGPFILPAQLIRYLRAGKNIRTWKGSCTMFEMNRTQSRAHLPPSQLLPTRILGTLETSVD